MRRLLALGVLIGAFGGGVGNARADFRQIYVVERGSGELSVVDPAGKITTLTTGLSDPLAVEILPNGNLIVAERTSDSIATIDPATGAILKRESAGMSPADLLVDGDGTVYVSSTSHTGIRRKRTGDATYSLFSAAPVFVGDMVRIGSFIYCGDYLGGGIYRVDPANPDPYSNFKAVASVPAGTGNGLTALGQDVLIPVMQSNRVIRATGIQPDKSASWVDFATGLEAASNMVPDGCGGYLLVHQKTLGSITRLSPSGTSTPFIVDSPKLSSPRGIALGSAPPTTNTRPSSDPLDPSVTVTPSDNSGGENVSVTFPSVILPGVTTVQTVTNGSPPPDGYQFVVGGIGVFYEIHTTAEWGGDWITLRLALPVGFTNPMLFHHVSGIWEKPPQHLETVDRQQFIVARIRSFSLFAIFDEIANMTPVANAGPDVTVEASGELTAVTLDASGSSDGDGDALSYEVGSESG